jgi:hypothetical protein
MKQNQSTVSPTHHFISRAVINRVNFPKREAGKMTRGQSLRSKQRAPLTAEDEAEVSQTVAMVLLQTGAFYAPLCERTNDKGATYFAPSVPFSIWRKIFSAVRDVILREKNTRAAYEESGILSNFDGADSRSLVIPADAALWKPTLSDPETLHRFQQRVALKRRALFVLVRAAWEADTNRKRNARMRRAVAGIRYVLGAVAGRGLCLADTFKNDAAKDRAMFDLRCYLSEGAIAHCKTAPRRLPSVLVIKALCDIPAMANR